LHNAPFGKLEKQPEFDAPFFAVPAPSHWQNSLAAFLFHAPNLAPEPALDKHPRRD